MVHISAVSRSPCLGACNGQLHANISETSSPASFTRQYGSPFRLQNIFCRDAITSMILFNCSHRSVGRWNPFLSPGTESPCGSTVRLRREKCNLESLSTLDHLTSLAFLHVDVSTARLCPVNHLTRESNLCMSVLQKGSFCLYSRIIFTATFYSSQAL